MIPTHTHTQPTLPNTFLPTLFTRKGQTFSVSVASWRCRTPWVRVTLLYCPFSAARPANCRLMIPTRICPRVQPGLDPTEKAKGLRGIRQQPLPPHSVHSPRVHTGRCVRVLSANYDQAYAPAFPLEPPQHPSSLGVHESFPGSTGPSTPARAHKDIEGAPRLEGTEGRNAGPPLPDLCAQCYAPVLAFPLRTLNRLGAGPRARSLLPSPPSPSPSPSSSPLASPLLLGTPCHQRGSFFRGLLLWTKVLSLL